MPSETADRSGELYIVDVDGVKNSEHRIFIEALKYGMELKRCFPRSEVKLRDAGENMPRNDTEAPKRIWGFGPMGKCAKSRQHNAKSVTGRSVWERFCAENSRSRARPSAGLLCFEGGGLG